MRLTALRRFSVAPPKGFDGNKDLFGHTGQASLYAKYRPRYNVGLVNTVLSRISDTSLCVDVACGSGQFTQLLAKHFKTVIGVDRSFEQLKEAESAKNVEYTPGKSNQLIDLLLPINSVPYRIRLQSTNKRELCGVINCRPRTSLAL